MDLLLKDRATAGRQLANVLAEHRKRGNVLVLAVAPGGVPVAAEIAKSVEAPLDVIVVHKLATSGDDGVVFGAIATGGSRALDWGVVSGMDVSDEMIEAVCTQEETEIERQTKLYRGDRLPPEVSKQRVILVDEGIDTGTTMHAAITAVRALQPARLILAVPVARFDVLRQLHGEVDEVVCLGTPYPWYPIDNASAAARAAVIALSFMVHLLKCVIAKSAGQSSPPMLNGSRGALRNCFSTSSVHGPTSRTQATARRA